MIIITSLQTASTSCSSLVKLHPPGKTTPSLIQLGACTHTVDWSWRKTTALLTGLTLTSCSPSFRVLAGEPTISFGPFNLLQSHRQCFIFSSVLNSWQLSSLLADDLTSYFTDRSNQKRISAGSQHFLYPITGSGPHFYPPSCCLGEFTCSSRSYPSTYISDSLPLICSRTSLHPFSPLLYHSNQH